MFRWCVAFMNAIMRLEDTLKSIDCPLLILHGNADPVSDVKSSQDLFDTVKSSDKEIKVILFQIFDSFQQNIFKKVITIIYLCIYYNYDILFLFIVLIDWFCSIIILRKQKSKKKKTSNTISFRIPTIIIFCVCLYYSLYTW